MKHIRNQMLAGILACFGAGALEAEPSDSSSRAPLVRGGVYDKPFITRVGRMNIGGYADAHFRYERVDGATDELTFLASRFNLFTFAPVSDRVRVASEIEFEEGGEEIALELAMVDFEVHPSFTVRAGVLIAPLGRFNLSHDSPVNPMVDRPLVSTMIIPSTLSETGMGFYGALYPTTSLRLTYELYAVNGLSEGIVASSEGGTRIPLGRDNFENNNNSPSLTGRVAISPFPSLEVGFSTHYGPYNLYDIEGIRVDSRRNLGIYALDGEFNWTRYYLNWEFAQADINIYPALRGLYAQQQRGFYIDGGVRFLRGIFPALPQSQFVGTVRYDSIDLDTDIPGDSEHKMTFGLNFKPADDTVFKFNYARAWQYDRFNVNTPSASILVAVATYF